MMASITARTPRKDLSIISSLILLSLVALSALTGSAMDEAPDVVPVEDIHALASYAMAAIAVLHALLNLQSMYKYVRRRVRPLSHAAVPSIRPYGTSRPVPTPSSLPSSGDAPESTRRRTT